MLEEKRDCKAAEDEGEKETAYTAVARKMLDEAAEAAEAGEEAIKSMVRKHLTFAVCMSARVAPRLPSAAGMTGNLAEVLLKYL